MSRDSKHVLVLRFSAMGDVALITPIIKSFLVACPSHTVTVVSRPKFAAFFRKESNVNFFSADVDKAYAGLLGMAKLFNHLRSLRPSVVIDLHDHIRSRLICFLFRLTGTKVVRFKKGRSEKKQITRKECKIRKELPHTVDRYRYAFAEAGFNFSIVDGPYLEAEPSMTTKAEEWLKKNYLLKNETWIGLAPFAAHKTKIWPLENYKELIERINERIKARFFLFGGGHDEVTFFNSLKSTFPNHCIVVAGELSLPEEIALIKKLDKMICVDSSNMHLAALTGTPTVSIWGGTHSATGFSAFGQSHEAIVQINTNELSCRPCSVYGKETCWRGDFACLNRIKPEAVLKHL